MKSSIPVLSALLTFAIAGCGSDNEAADDDALKDCSGHGEYDHDHWQVAGLQRRQHLG